MNIVITEFQNKPIILATHTIDGVVKLVLAKWIEPSEAIAKRFIEDKTLQKLMKHFKLSQDKIVVTQLSELKTPNRKNGTVQKQKALDSCIRRNEVYQFANSMTISTNNKEQSLLQISIKQLAEYKAGDRSKFELPLDVSVGTEFQQKVWQALQQIDYGQTISYAQLARKIGKPTGFRAVANANGKNPITIIIPCHRVIASDGGLGGYTGGLDKKQILLTIESQQ